MRPSFLVFFLLRYSSWSKVVDNCNCPFFIYIYIFSVSRKANLVHNVSVFSSNPFHDGWPLLKVFVFGEGFVFERSVAGETWLSTCGFSYCIYRWIDKRICCVVADTHVYGQITDRYVMYVCRLIQPIYILDIDLRFVLQNVGRYR